MNILPNELVCKIVEYLDNSTLRSWLQCNSAYTISRNEYLRRRYGHKKLWSQVRNYEGASYLLSIKRYKKCVLGRCLAKASSVGVLPIVKLLLSYGATDVNMALSITSSTEVATYLITRKLAHIAYANIELLYDDMLDKPRLFYLLTKSPCIRPLVHYLVYRGNIDLLSKALNETDIRFPSLLCTACRYHSVRTVEYLVNTRGYEVDHRHNLPLKRAFTSWTPENDTSHVADYLIGEGANMYDRGIYARSYILMAINCRSILLLKILEKHGAVLENCPRILGIAIILRWVDGVEYLLSRGVDQYRRMWFGIISPHRLPFLPVADNKICDILMKWHVKNWRGKLHRLISLRRYL